MDRESLSEYLKRVLSETGATYGYLARAAGCSFSHVQQVIMYDRTPGRATADKLRREARKIDIAALREINSIVNAVRGYYRLSAKQVGKETGISAMTIYSLRDPAYNLSLTYRQLLWKWAEPRLSQMQIEIARWRDHEKVS